MTGMEKSSSDKLGFEGEEADAGLASPALDLIASGFLIALSLLVMVTSIQLPIPGGLSTAPGLLPFLTAASLAAMAIVLSVSAVKRKRAGIAALPSEARDPVEDRRAALLAIIVAIYISGLQLLAFQIYFSIGTIPFVLSAFEPLTILVLVTIIHVFWQGAFWVNVVISTLWTLTLSVVFQKLFTIPLPGGF